MRERRDEGKKRERDIERLKKEKGCEDKSNTEIERGGEREKRGSGRGREEEEEKNGEKERRR